MDSVLAEFNTALGSNEATADPAPRMGATPYCLPAWAQALPQFPPKSWRPMSFGEDHVSEPEPEPVLAAHPELLRLVGVEHRLGYSFRDRRLLRCALTSPGWVNEHSNPIGGRWPGNKALEWLGDAVLYRFVTEDMVRCGEAACTGTSTPARAVLISNAQLARVGESLDIWDALYLGNGERTTNQTSGRPRFLACVVEAIIGAAHLDARAASTAAELEVESLVKRLVVSLRP